MGSVKRSGSFMELVTALDAGGQESLLEAIRQALRFERRGILLVFRVGLWEVAPGCE